MAQSPVVDVEISNFIQLLCRNFTRKTIDNNSSFEKIPVPKSFSCRITFFFSGGESGDRGLNLLVRECGQVINLGAKTSIAVNPGVSHFFVSFFSILQMGVKILMPNTLRLKKK